MGTSKNHGKESNASAVVTETPTSRKSKSNTCLKPATSYDRPSALEYMKEKWNRSISVETSDRRKSDVGRKNREELKRKEPHPEPTNTEKEKESLLDTPNTQVEKKILDIIAPFTKKAKTDEPAKTGPSASLLVTPVSRQPPKGTLKRSVTIPAESPMTPHNDVYKRFTSVAQAEIPDQSKRPRLEKLTSMPVANTVSSADLTEDCLLAQILHWNPAWLTEYSRFLSFQLMLIYILLVLHVARIQPLTNNNHATTDQ